MLTREQIEKQPWFGVQRTQVLELLDRAQKAEKRAERLRDWAVSLVARMPALSQNGQADSDMRADLQREIAVIWSGRAAP